MKTGEKRSRSRSPGGRSTPDRPPPPPAPPLPRDPKQCGRTQVVLDKFFRDSGFGRNTAAFNAYFTPGSHPPTCLECGGRIGEHNAGEQGRSTPQVYECNEPWPRKLVAQFPEATDPQVDVDELPADLAAAQEALKGVLLFFPDSGWLIGGRDETRQPSATEGGNEVRFKFAASAIPRTKHVVRHDYKAIWTTVKKMIASNYHGNSCGLRMEGHPGVGKSVSLDLFLRWSMNDFPTIPIVVLCTEGAHVLVPSADGEHGQRYIMKRDQAKWSESTLSEFLLSVYPTSPDRRPPLLILHDLAPRLLPFQGVLVQMLCNVYSVSCILATSPNRDNYKAFEKFDTFDDLKQTYVHTLTPRESVAYFVECVAPYLGGTLSWKDAFKEAYRWAGGVPRGLKRVTLRLMAGPAGVEDLEMLKKDIRDCARRLKYNPNHTGGDCDSHRIVHRLKDDMFDFVSAEVRREWVRSHKWRVVLKALRYVENFLTTPGTAYGHFFADAALKFLTLGSLSPLHNAVCEILTTEGAPASESTPFRLNLAPFAHKEVVIGGERMDLERLKGPTVLIPEAKNYPLVDAMLVQRLQSGTLDVTLLQVTVQSSHNAQSSSVRSFLDRMPLSLQMTVRILYVTPTASTLRSRQTIGVNRGTPDTLQGMLARCPQYVCQFDFGRTLDLRAGSSSSDDSLSGRQKSHEVKD